MNNDCLRCGKGKLHKKKGYIYCDNCTYEEYDGEEEHNNK